MPKILSKEKLRILSKTPRPILRRELDDILYTALAYQAQCEKQREALEAVQCYIDGKDLPKSALTPLQTYNIPWLLESINEKTAEASVLAGALQEIDSSCNKWCDVDKWRIALQDIAKKALECRSEATQAAMLVIEAAVALHLDEIPDDGKPWERFYTACRDYLRVMGGGSSGN